jgi:hypothetical protein
LRRNGHQLETLIISSHPKNGSPNRLLEALAVAAAAAQAAGVPFQLHTLLVLGHSIRVPLLRRLLASLSHLRCLQLQISNSDIKYGEARTWLEQDLAFLQAARELRELYVDDARCGCGDVAAMLPTNLRRLSWPLVPSLRAPSLSHLTGLSFLHLAGGCQEELSSSKLPTGLQELQLLHHTAPEELVLERRKALTGVRVWMAADGDALRHLPLLTNLTTANVEDGNLHNAVRVQLPKLSSLAVWRLHTYTWCPC